MKQGLVDLFHQAISEKRNYVFTEIYIEGYPSSEIIVNPINNAEIKLQFLLENYDDELKNVRSPHISILSYGFVDDMGELEYVHTLHD